MKFLNSIQSSRRTIRRRGPPHSIAPSDRLAMEYIWRWKIASTSSIHAASNRSKSPYSTYKRLEKLERNGFIEARFNPCERFYVWQLTEMGFEAIKMRLGELKEDGYLSENHYHDRLVQAFQLGEWVNYQFPQVIFYTEQQLRRIEMDNHPNWVPKAAGHRADGYTRIIGDKKASTLAYEVELSAKSVQRYENVLQHYRSVRLVDRVVWLVSDHNVRDTILRAKHCIKDDSKNYHVFVDLSEYEKSGWDSIVTNECSENLFTLREKYQEICGEIPGQLLGKFKGQQTVNVHLDCKKVIGKSRA